MIWIERDMWNRDVEMEQCKLYFSNKVSGYNTKH